jgi:hypothetical protein
LRRIQRKCSLKCTSEAPQGPTSSPGRHGQPKERTWGNCGSQKKLATAGRKMARHARVARRKVHVRKNQTRGKAERGTLKRWTFGRRQQVHVKDEKTVGRIFRKTFRLEIVKRAAGSSVGLRKIRDWTSWRSRPPPKWKKSLLAA